MTALVLTAAGTVAVGTFPSFAGRLVVAFEPNQTTGPCCEYDRAEADARHRVDEARTQSGEGTPELASADNALVKALLANGRGAAPSTLAMAERVLETSESLLGPRNPASIPSLVNLGDALVAGGKYERAIALLQRAVGLQERQGADTVDFADTLDHLASGLIAADRFDIALTTLERSLRIKEQRLGAGNPEIARTLERIGFALQRKGDYEKAAQPIRRADEIQRRVNPADPEYVQTLNLVAQQLWFEGRLQESMTTSERALSLAERTLRPDHPTVARSLRFLAGTLEDLGYLERAHVLRDRALAIVEREFGPNHYETAIYLNSAGSADQRLGAYPAARARFETAARIFEAQFGASHDYVATARLNLALVDASLGDYAGATREQSRATAIWERTLGPNHPFVALALTEMAGAFREQGRPAQALPLLERALAIRERSLGPEHRDVARTLTQLAATLQGLGNIGVAQRHAARALRILQTKDEADAPDFADALTLYAQLQLARGSVDEARTYYEQALAIRGRVFGRSHPAFAETQAGLALTLAAAGYSSDALAGAIEAEQVSRSHLGLILAHLPERQSLNYAASRPKGLDLILSLAGSTPGAARTGLDETIKSRALVLDEMVVRRGGDHGNAQEAAPLRTGLAAARQRLANLVVRGPGDMPVARYSALIDEARRESESAEQRLAEQSADFRAELTHARIGLDDVSTAMPPDGAIVSFIRYTRSVFVSESMAGPLSTRTRRPAIREISSYIALVMRRGEPPVAVPLGSAQAIDTLVTEWRTDVAARDATLRSAASPARSSRLSGGRLRRTIWDPVASHLGNATRIFIVPDGSLNLVPFAALPIGSRSYLVETGPVLHYLSAERDIVPSSHPSTRASEGLLAIGAPAFDARPALSARSKLALPVTAPPTSSLRGVLQPCGGLQGMTFPPLVGTLREVRELSALWNAEERSPDEPGTSHVLVGRQATETSFKREAHQYRVLHIATHGFFVGDNCSPAVPGTRGVGGLVASRPDGIENPLLLSGVAFAGANRRAEAPAGDDDGVLTAEEVASLDLGSVEWAVLSACDTGIGEIRPGEGVLGLRRAFQIAGARTVVMSLWSVEDQAARAWMRVLYEGRFQKRLSSADAVHRASLTMLLERRARRQSTEPFYWAAFVAAGDWR